MKRSCSTASGPRPSRSSRHCVPASRLWSNDDCADAFDIPAHEIDRVLSTLDPVIEHDGPTSGPAVTHRVVVDGASLAAELLRRLLSEQEAVALLPPESGSTGAGSQPGRVDVAVLVADFVIPPSRYTRWLRDDVPHLPVVFSDRVVRIGPFVTPGSGPCLHCVELHRTDDDPAWPAVASQLLGRRSPLDTQLLGAEVATRVTRSGAPTPRRVPAHPREHPAGGRRRDRWGQAPRRPGALEVRMPSSARNRDGSRRPPRCCVSDQDRLSSRLARVMPT